MAFTTEEKTRLLFYLGYSVFEDDGPAMRAYNSLDSKEAVGGFIIRELLVKLSDIEREIHKTILIAKAIEDGSIKIRAHYTLDHMWRLGRSYVVQLSRFTKVAIDGDVFSTSGTDSRVKDEFYTGDPSERRQNY